MYSALEILKNI
ncbi:hypothetical protein EYZ11_013233 [Aspergillus tanneri]|uniref:Uncharacterized protein n=1 Tax=Aspergillus tanneri TaxID=1220188 RepID=A0A4S3IY96_9EURO|nr:hypothetical protein EYZ11_013233 [Aspergillus tanneri]